MKKINKKTIIYVLVIISAITLIHYFSVKENNLQIETISEDTVTEIMRVNEKDEINDEKEQVDTEIKEKIIVYITGAIKNEGIYEMEENSRIADVIEKAGGLLENAYIKDINLAYVVLDGMKIYISTKEEKDEEIKDNTDIYVSNQYNSFNVINEEKSTKGDVKININTATQTELETLPGIGPSTALSIIDYRKNNGKFNTIDDIKNVSGIGDNKFLKIKDLIKV